MKKISLTIYGERRNERGGIKEEMRKKRTKNWNDTREKVKSLNKLSQFLFFPSVGDARTRLRGRREGGGLEEARKVWREGGVGGGREQGGGGSLFPLAGSPPLDYGEDKWNEVEDAAEGSGAISSRLRVD